MLFVIAAVVACWARTFDGDLYQFADFKQTYNKQYAPSEEAHRFGCFRQNLDEQELLNQKNPLAHFGVNQFSDMCKDEFKSMYHGLRAGNTSASVWQAPAGYVPLDSIDWRTKGAVAPVKNQGRCGSCWAFSTTMACEGSWAVKNKLVALADGEVTQCCKTSHGCNGGNMATALEWVVQNGGLDSEADYPYTSGSGVTGQCDTAKEKKHVATFSKHVNIQGEEGAEKYCSGSAPLSIGVDATSFQSYSGGIMTSCASSQLDHGVGIVGYDNDNSPPYWIIKNSWGTTWGESGYIRLKKGENLCLCGSFLNGISV